MQQTDPTGKLIDNRITDYKSQEHTQKESTPVNS